jgi:hypothetical protein
VEEARKKKETEKILSKSPIKVASTFNLEENWKEKRKVFHQSELDCLKFNIEQSTKVPKSIRSKAVAMSPATSRDTTNTLAHSGSNANMDSLKNSIFQTVGQASLNSSEMLTRAKQIDELSKKYNTNNVEMLPKLEYEKHRINAFRSHFNFS